MSMLCAALTSCYKEFSCERCVDKNKPPIAIAGPDQVISLPTDSVVLDGSASNDPDGSIDEWLWKKVSGPATYSLHNNASPSTLVKNLITGTYMFELKVTDSGGLYAMDTVQVIINSAAQSNRPPVADAGPDQTLTLPFNSTKVNGSGSKDPDNNITSHVWKKVSGPLSFTIANTNSIETEISNLVEGHYNLELTVTDAGGLFSKDTMIVAVINSGVRYTCGDSNRSHIKVNLIEIGTLSVTRTGMAVASANNKILFAGGGYHYNNLFTTRVDIYDIITQKWSMAELSHPRFDIASVSAGNKIFFAGGDDTDGSSPSDKVDVYDANTNTWLEMSLSRRDEGIAAASVGSKILFAGGIYQSRTVDIYDVTMNSWSTATLPLDLYGAIGVTVGSKVYFAGGHCSSGVVYDNTTGSWSTFPLPENNASIAGINVGDNVYWAGGFICNSENTSCTVQIQNLNSGNVVLQTLAAPAAFWKNGGQTAVMKDNKIIFYASLLSGSHPYNRDKFNIYDVSTGVWTIGILPFPVESGSIISVNNEVYLAGGLVNGVLSNKVWKLEF